MSAATCPDCAAVVTKDDLVQGCYCPACGHDFAGREPISLVGRKLLAAWSNTLAAMEAAPLDADSKKVMQMTREAIDKALAADTASRQTLAEEN